MALGPASPRRALPGLLLAVAALCAGPAQGEDPGREWLAVTVLPPNVWLGTDLRAELLPARNHGIVGIIHAPLGMNRRGAGLQYRYYLARSGSLALDLGLETLVEAGSSDGDGGPDLQLAPVMGFKVTLPIGLTLDFQFGHAVLHTDREQVGDAVTNIGLGYTFARGRQRTRNNEEDEPKDGG
jgi:hypothetical protein